MHGLDHHFIVVEQGSHVAVIVHELDRQEPVFIQVLAEQAADGPAGFERVEIREILALRGLLDRRYGRGFLPLAGYFLLENDVLVFLHAAFPGDLDGVHGPGGQEGPGLVDGGVLVGRRRIDRPPVCGHGENFEMDLAA